MNDRVCLCPQYFFYFFRKLTFFYLNRTNYIVMGFFNFGRRQKEKYSIILTTIGISSISKYSILLPAFLLNFKKLIFIINHINNKLI